ncbi:MAG: hypothetical protein D6824_00630 [Planctomycetota bacterium]|nr:MAG: hypothetical protein D6824_00630 [Planctomycetota bacterium]
MDGSRRGFALVLTLLAAAGLTALAMQGGAAARLSVVEAAVRASRAQQLRDAESAALLAALALVRAGGGEVDLQQARQSAEQLAEKLEDDSIPDLPPGLPIKELLESLRASDQPAGPASDSGAAGGVSLSTSRPSAVDALKRAGLPGAPLVVSLPSIEEGSGTGRRLVVRFVDEGGLVDVNKASLAQLQRCFVEAGVQPFDAAALAQQIVDWRDEDSFVRPLGAEREAYEARGVRIRNGPFLSLAELAYLPAATPSTLAKVGPYLTTRGDGSIHAPTAPWPVLASAPGLSRDAAQRIVEARGKGELDEAKLRAITIPFGEEAFKAFRFEPSGFLRAIVMPEDGGAATLVEVVMEQRGPRVVASIPLERALAERGM